MDILEDGLTCSIAGGKTLLGIDQLFLERRPKAFHTSVIQAGTFSSETRLHLLSCKLTLIGVRGVLGEFNRSMQHLDGGELWDVQRVGVQLKLAGR